MPNLEELKTRLVKLPQRRTERHLSDIFANYTARVSQIGKKLIQVHKDIGYIAEAFPNSGCETKVVPLLRSSVKEAKKLYREIEDDPNTVEKKGAGNSVEKLGDYSNMARTKCDEIWEKEITGNITKWEKIAEVVQKLGAKGGHEFKQAVDKLKVQKIPKNDNEVSQIKTAQKALQKGIANLGLEGSLGRFLKAAAEEGASTKDLLDEEIRKKMDEHKLWDAFSVRLQ